jgi:hypothetical protein
VDLHLQPHWQDMLGLYVEIRLQGRTVRVGTVDAVMPDDSILWISAEGPYPRQMVARADGFEVFAPYAGSVPRAHLVEVFKNGPGGLPTDTQRNHEQRITQ